MCKKVKFPEIDRTHLNDEVADHATVVGVHARTKSVENARHTHFEVQLGFVRVPIFNIKQNRYVST